MNQEDYFASMERISGAVDSELESLVQKIGCDNDSHLKGLLQKRKGKPKARPYLTQLCYELSGGEGLITQANAVSEMNNINMYLDNWILDDKNSVWNNRSRISDITISSQVSRELTDLLIKSIGLDSDTELRLRDMLNRAIISCYKGQKTDLEMTIDTSEDYADEKYFLEAYKKKCESTSGQLYAFSTTLGGIMAKADDRQMEALHDFGKAYGTGLHISNDLGDFALFEHETTLKSYQDQMADLMNRRLTLPIYLALKYGTQGHKMTLLKVASGVHTEEHKILASRAIIESGSYERTMSVVKDYWRTCRDILHANYPKCPQRDKLSRTLSTIRSNKYLTNIKCLSQLPN